MNLDDRSFMKLLYIVMGFLVTMGVCMIILAQIIGGASPEEFAQIQASKDEALLSTAGDAIETYEVVSAGASATESETSGYADTPASELYTSKCSACHMTGAAGAPKLESAAWEARVAQGFDTLSDHAINGFNTMPAKGGAADLSDNDVNRIIGYMITEAGFADAVPADLGGSADAATATTEATVPDTDDLKATETETVAVANKTATSTDTVVANEASKIATVATKTETVAAPAIETTETASAVSETAASTETVAATETASAMSEAVASTETVTTPAIAATETTSAVSETVASIAPSAEVESAQSEHSPEHLAEGEKVYTASCAVCHAAGIANAPKLGDTTAWEPRIAAGYDTLLDSMMNGKNAMPPRGATSPDLVSDEQLQAAMDYMLSTVQ